MKKLIIFTTVFILVLVFVVPGILAIPIKIVPANDQPGYSTDYKRGVYGKHIIRQEFISMADNLTGIGLSIGNPNLKNKKDVILNLYENTDEGLAEPQQVLRQSILNGQNISDGAFVRFLFDPITNSKDVKYYFTLETPSAGDEEVINIYFNKDRPGWIGDLKIDTEAIDGEMPMVTYHKSQSRFATIRNIYVNWLGRLFGTN